MSLYQPFVPLRLRASVTKEPTAALIQEMLQQCGISTRTSGISKHIPALMDVIVDSLSNSINEQPRSRMVGHTVVPMGERPGTPPGLGSGYITGAQRDYDFLVKCWEEQRHKKEMARQSRKRKKQDDHSGSTRRRVDLLGTHQHTDVAQVIPLGKLWSLIVSAHPFLHLTRRTYHQ